MSHRTWMPMYWGDYLKNTPHLTTLEHGAYVLLIAAYWQTGPLPDDDKKLAAIVRQTVWKWRRHIRPTMEPFFVIDEILERPPISNAKQLQSKCWHHKRIDDELEKAEIISTKRRIAGMLGGRKSNGYANITRHGNKAFVKQTGHHSQSKDIKEETEKAEQKVSQETKLPVTPSLVQAVKAKGWGR